MRRLIGCLILVAALVVVTINSVEAQFFPGMGGFKQSPITLIMNKSVQEELKLTEEQIKAFTEGQKEAFKLMPKFDPSDLAKLKELKPEEIQAKMAEMMKPINEANEKLLAKTLKPEQSKRLNQIVRQQAGIQAFTQEDVQKELGLTDDQKKKIKGILDDLTEDVAELSRPSNKDKEKGKGGFGFPRLSPEAREKIAKLREKAKESILDTLTAAQKDKWKELVGEPFELKNPFGGGFGGFPKKDN